MPPSGFMLVFVSDWESSFPGRCFPNMPEALNLTPSTGKNKTVDAPPREGV